ncbi:MAG: glycosyl hydrolase, partial [Robiginitalea sp.]|nr:glycosyl hydrolase [Robiginitalea sp.]
MNPPRFKWALKPMSLILFLAASYLALAQTDPAVFKDLDFRFIGPEGNRAIAIAGVPGDPMVNYVGAASGGLWKTTDGGITWDPVFDGQEASSIGSVALAPSNPDIVWVGTGETFVIRPAHAMGDGIYKSEDAGKTWKKMGLEKTGRIGRILIHPTNPDIVYAAALGHTYGP